jgi:hypothetical protein
VALNRGDTVLEHNSVFALGKQVRKPTSHCMFGYSAHLEDSPEETLPRRFPAEDAFRHGFTHTRRSTPEVQHGQREEEPCITTDWFAASDTREGPTCRHSLFDSAPVVSSEHKSRIVPVSWLHAWKGDSSHSPAWTRSHGRYYIL